MIYTMRKRAKERGESFDLTEQDLQPAPTHCPVFGVELKYGAGRRQPHSASVDRIDPSKGYVKGNVHIISDRANRAKNDLTLDELRRLVAFCETLK